MTALQAYLQNSKTRKVLSKRPGEAGFSLIELVVVVAVLAILSAIAIPAFTSISEKARAAAAANTLATIVKECAVKLNDNPATATYNIPTLNGYGESDGPLVNGQPTNLPNGWQVSVVTAGVPAAASAAPAASPATCTDNNEYRLISSDTTKYPTFKYNNSNGSKTCVASGNALERGCPVDGGSW